MNVVMLLLVLAFVGFAAWLLIQFVPMPPAIKTVIIIAAVLIDLVILINAFGGLPNIKLQPLR